MHAGAKAAVRADLADFFGSVRPRHLGPWLGLAEPVSLNLLPDWSEAGRRAILALGFLQRQQGPQYLAQGAPSSPLLANLAGLWLDMRILEQATLVFGKEKFRYSRYADDQVLSSREPTETFIHQAEKILQDAADHLHWRLQLAKSRRWMATDPDPLHLCGLSVPRTLGGPLDLDRPTARCARAALHRLRHRIPFEARSELDPNHSHALLSYAYMATGQLRYLAYSSRLVQALARSLAGFLFSECFLAGFPCTSTSSR